MDESNRTLLDEMDDDSKRTEIPGRAPRQG